MSEASSDYSHRFHAGNVGDVWKHLVWACVLRGFTSGPRPPLRIIETHAGEGVYKLAPTGEWTQGVQRVGQGAANPAPTALSLYRDVLARFPASVYPGSPLITLQALRKGDAATFYEIAPEAAARLARRLGATPGICVRGDDGMAALAAFAPSGPDLQDVVFVDPPYTAKSDWVTIPRALVELRQRALGACIVLWYPIKSYTRPNALLETCDKAGVPALALDLVTTPLKLQRNRLNGSGMLLVGAPPTAASDALAAAAPLGALCATHGGYWTARATQVGCV
jgi:23S rRNA (adenine2030-N6)-methyltransferase